MKTKWKIDEWIGCYPSQWKGMIVAEAMSHPAKFSSKLIRKIYEHMKDEGWLKEGDIVLDPFGGVSLGALDAMRMGLRWRGSELEAKFVDLGSRNIEIWNERFSRMPHWCQDAKLLQGDSRFLLKVLGNGHNGAVSSPPFRHSEGGTPEPKPGGTIDAALYARHAAGNSAAEGYGGTEGQLANMGEGDFQGAISSPPFVDTVLHDGGPAQQQGGELHSEYGTSDGQLGTMRGDGFDAAVSSPPFENSEASKGSRKFKDPEAFAAEQEAKYRSGEIKGHFASKEAILKNMQKEDDHVYGETEGNIGNDSGDDFWLAARQIVEQVYLALAPGAHAAWVVKAFVKNKELVDFPDQWRQLCEAVGFVTIHEHRAQLVHHKGTSHTLEGGTVEHKTESKSFFRRLAEKKGSPRIDFETVWCMEKPVEVES